MAADRNAAAQALSRTASELARRWANQRLTAVQSYGRILAEYGSGRSTGRDTVQAYAKLAVEEAVRYPTDAYGLASEYASALARAAGFSIGAEQSTQSRSPVLDIELTGVPGRVATRTFVLENPHDAPVRIGFVATPFHDGERELNVAPTIKPADIAIPANGEQAVTVSVKVDRKNFSAGKSYRSIIAVEGFDELVIRVHLTVAGAA